MFKKYILTLFAGFVFVCNAQNLDSLIFADVENTNWQGSIYEQADCFPFYQLSPIQRNYTSVDSFALSFNKKYKDALLLSHELTDRWADPKDKLRAIYRWITNNISYDVVEFHYAYLNIRDDFSCANRVLKRQKAVCAGYSKLFKVMCNEVGIDCEITYGYAIQDPTGLQAFKEKWGNQINHAWNKVKLDEQWYMIDVAWSSGYCDDKVSKFTQEFNEDYFLTPIERSYATHTMLGTTLAANYFLPFLK